MLVAEGAGFRAHGCKAGSFPAWWVSSWDKSCWPYLQMNSNSVSKATRKYPGAVQLRVPELKHQGRRNWSFPRSRAS